MKEQELRQALQNVTKQTPFSEQHREAVWERIRKAENIQSVGVPAFPKGMAAAVLLMVFLLGGIVALAAERLGILSFAKERGEAVTPDHLITQEQLAHMTEYRLSAPYLKEGTSQFVQFEPEEMLYEDGWLYMTMTVKPKQENTMIFADELQRYDEQRREMGLSITGNIQDINQPGTMKAFAEKLGISPEMSVKEYAESKGFDQVLRLAVSSFVKHTDYELMEDGSLRMIVQAAYSPYFPPNYPKELYDVWVPLQVVAFGADGLLPAEDKFFEHIELHVSGPFMVDSRSRVSIPEDEHDIEGYRGRIESVRVTPISDDTAAVIIQMDEEKRAYGETVMSGPVVVILDKNGEVLKEATLYRNIDDMRTLADGRVIHNILVPWDRLPEEKITIRLHSWNNHNIVYDEYTYTLQSQQPSNSDEHTVISDPAKEGEMTK